MHYATMEQCYKSVLRAATNIYFHSRLFCWLFVQLNYLVYETSDNSDKRHWHFSFINVLNDYTSLYVISSDGRYMLYPAHSQMATSYKCNWFSKLSTFLPFIPLPKGQFVINVLFSWFALSLSGILEISSLVCVMCACLWNTWADRKECRWIYFPLSSWMLIEVHSQRSWSAPVCLKGAT